MTDKEVKNQESEESTENSGSHILEKLEAAGQIIIGEIELIGGVLTADPLTQAEGEFNIETGAIEAEIVAELEEGETSESGSDKDL
jgi:hypothetical protein